MIKLFLELMTYQLFHFGNRSDRILMKSDPSHYICPEGRRHINPTVAVIPIDKKKEESNGQPNDNSKD